MDRELKQKIPHITEMYWGTDGVWSDGYFVTTVGIDEEGVYRTTGSIRYRANEV